jgi:hypothetical protein
MGASLGPLVSNRCWDGPDSFRYAHTVAVIRTGLMGWLRTSVGIALIAAPGAPMRLAGTESPTGTALLLMRTIGIRDLVLGLGTVAAAQTGDDADARRWAMATLASDALDTVVSLSAMRAIGRRDSLFAAGLALAFVCADLQALRTASHQAGRASPSEVETIGSN